MRVKTLIYIVLITTIVIVYFFFRRIETEYNGITTYQECILAGYPSITNIYPEECRIPGKVFTNPSQKASTDVIATSTTLSKNYKNGTYIIEGESITLKNGTALRESAPGSASMDTVRYFGNEVRGDFDGNDTEDIAFLMTRESGGSGTFFYLAVALLSPSHEYVGINTIFLGDRIAPQTTELKNNQIVVNYAERKPSDPMTIKPSIGVSRYFKIINRSLVEVTD